MNTAEQTGAAQQEQIEALKAKLLHDIRRSVYVYRIDCGGCNGCEIEIFASLTPLFDVERFGIKVVPSPRHADVLVYTGPMTRAMRLPAFRAYRAAPDPKIVVAYGACGCSGGIFHDSYAVWGGAENLFPVDLYIPGCPPSPYATIYGFATVLGLLEQKIRGQQHRESEEEKGVELTVPAGINPNLRKKIERTARRLCGYWQGKRIAADYFKLLAESPDDVLDYRLEGYLSRKGDPRLTEVYRAIHRIYREWVNSRA